MNRYDIVIIGSGPAGYTAAIHAAREGASVCIVERSDFGGVCLNTGCIPAKSLIASSSFLRRARRAKEFGVAIDGDALPDIQGMHERKNRIVDIERTGLKKLVVDSGADILNGTASFVDRRTIRVNSPEGEQFISSKSFIIATGSEPRPLPFLPFDGIKILSSDDLLNRGIIPESIIIIGGGYIGCEFASMLSAFGTKVTIVEMMPRLVMNVDDAITAILVREFKKEKIQIKTGVKITGAHVGDRIKLSLEGGEELEAEAALVAIGRRPFYGGLNLSAIPVMLRANGSIGVNNQMITNVPGILAAGDVVGNPMLAHTAFAESRVAIGNAMGNRYIMDYRVVPSAIYTHPEIGCVGLTEGQARELGMDVSVGSVEMRAIGISHASGEIAGVVKIIADAIADTIVGAHAIGERATDIIHEVAVAMSQGMSATMLGRVIHAHPTFSEAIVEAAQSISGESTYMSKKIA